MKKIVIINGHPNKESFNFALANAYKKGAEQSNAELTSITIADLDFNPNLQYGYKKRTELEPDLLAAWEKIKEANHLVWIHPVWWGGLPAITKGFIDRLCFQICGKLREVGQTAERKNSTYYYYNRSA